MYRIIKSNVLALIILHFYESHCTNSLKLPSILRDGRSFLTPGGIEMNVPLFVKHSPSSLLIICTTPITSPLLMIGMHRILFVRYPVFWSISLQSEINVSFRSSDHNYDCSSAQHPFSRLSWRQCSSLTAFSTTEMLWTKFSDIMITSSVQHSFERFFILSCSNCFVDFVV